MSAGTTNAAASGGGLSIIASGTMSSPNPADVTTTLSSPAKMLIAQVIGYASVTPNVIQEVACLLPGETINLSHNASAGLSGNGQVISYTAGSNYDYEHLKYIALG